MKVVLDDPDSDDINNHQTGGLFKTNSETSNVRRIAQEYGTTPKAVKDAIHKIKAQGAWRGNGGNRNPDVVVDLETGEVHVQLPDGSASEDSLGNILDELED